METVNSLLETSSIHGVFHIAASRKSIKLFWIFVVFSGFLVSGILIHQSFKSWNENPITTTIETVPISEMILPNITVCPPKDTFTDLNHELKIAENLTLDNETREKLLDYVMDLLLDVHFLNMMKNQSILQEDKMYFNWYHGYSEIGRVSYSFEQLYYPVGTTATSGTISTPDFGKEFNASKIDPAVRLSVHFQCPENVTNSDNVTLTIEYEVNLMKGISKGYDRFSIDIMDDVKSTHLLSKTYRLPKHYPPSLKLDRKVTKAEIYKSKMDLMPGFRATWFYSKELEPKREFFKESYPQSILYRK